MKFEVSIFVDHFIDLIQLLRNIKEWVWFLWLCRILLLRLHTSACWSISWNVPNSQAKLKKTFPRPSLSLWYKLSIKIVNLRIVTIKRSIQDKTLKSVGIDHKKMPQRPTWTVFHLKPILKILAGTVLKVLFSYKVS